MTNAEFLAQLAKTHAAIFGTSGSGKSVFLQQVADQMAKNPLAGFTFMCPHGTARLVAERLSNPARGAGRVVHVLDFASGMTWGANPFETYDDSWEACHEASLLWTSSVSSLYATAMQQTPRLETTCYVLGMFAAAKGLTLNDLLPAISLAGERIREFLLTDFDNAPVRDTLQDLHILAARQPRQFLELLESFRNRTVRWLGDKRLARLLGKQKGLDAKAVMDGKEIVLIDLAALALDDAAFVMTLLLCRYLAAAKRRTPDLCAPHHLIVDEAASSLCTATAQMLDQTRKFGLFGAFSFQRIGQLQEKGEFITEAVMVNAGAKIVFSMPEPRSARFLAEMLFTPHLDLQEWKPGSSRPTAVGNELRITRSRSRARHHAEQHGSATSDMRSHGRVSAMSHADMSAWGSGFSDGNSASFASTPPDPLFASVSPLSQSQGHNHARNLSASGARSSARSSASQTARMRGSTQSHALAEGASVTHGESEAYVTVYDNLPTQMYSVEEQLTRLTGEIMGLQPRECFIKLPYREPYRTRTKDLQPAYRSLALKQHILPRFLANAAAASPYLKPVAHVDADLAARAKRLVTPPATPDPDFAAPEPIPTPLDDPLAYADGFRSRRGNATKRQRKPKPFRVIDGGAADGDKQHE